MQHKYIKILIIESVSKSLLLEEVLKDRNIPHLIRSYHDSVYDGVFQLQQGWGHVEAPTEYAEEILNIYNSL